MRLEPGSALLHYRLVDKLGEGGMGVVWRAQDTTLDREVAIKVLPAEFATDADRLARFEREAKLLASLNHPNIAAIHALHEDRGLRFLAMELVQGETLAARLERGAMQLDEALPIAGQILEALEAAHASGVIHRDLKPANVQVTPDGTVKVLDFGLAKALESVAGSTGADGTRSPTLTFRATQVGTILGTAAYMSPEQARGQTADARSDLWSFGVVLWEMLTGERLFVGETVSDTLAAVLRADPEWERLPAATPPSARRLLRRCLARAPQERMRHAGDALLDLRDAAAERTPGGTTERATRWPVLLPWAVAAVLLAAVILLVATIERTVAPALPNAVFKVPPPPGQVFNAREGPARLSPDGTRLVAALVRGGEEPQLGVRRLDDDRFSLLADNELIPDAPFWSADGRSVGFFAWAKKTLMTVAADGGPPRTVCDAGEYMGGAWNEDGVILFAPDNGPILRVALTGGTPKPITELDADRDERAHWWPQFLPDGRRFLFLAVQGRDPWQAEAAAPDLTLWVGSIDGGVPRQVPGAFEGPVEVASPGYLLYTEQTTLMARPFDPQRLAWLGDPQVLADGLYVRRGGAQATFSTSRNGILAYHELVDAPRIKVVRRGRDGTPLSEISVPARRDLARHYLNPDLSPNGRWLAIERHDPETNRDIWILDLARGGAQRRFTYHPASERGPVWSPDGRHLAFVRKEGERFSVLRIPVQGGDGERVLFGTETRVEVVDWSPDGAWLLLESDRPGDLHYLSADGGQEPQSFAATPFFEHSGRFSLDGKWVAYTSDETGREEIYIRPWPGQGASFPVSTAGGNGARWGADGGTIYYVHDEALMAAAVRLDGETPEIELPEMLFESDGLSADYELAGTDGEFLFVERDDTEGAPLTVVLNWRALLESPE